MLLFNSVLTKLKSSMQNYKMCESIKDKEACLNEIEVFVDLLLDSEDIDILIRNENKASSITNPIKYKPNTYTTTYNGMDNVALLNQNIQVDTTKRSTIESITNDFMEQSQR